MTARTLAAIAAALFAAAYGTVVTDVNRPALAEAAAVTALAAAGLFLVSWRMAFRPYPASRIPVTDLRLYRGPEGRPS